MRVSAQWKFLALSCALVLLPGSIVAQTSTVAWRATPASRMKAALRSVAAAQERYRATYRTYTVKVEALNFEAEPGIRVQVLAASTTGWQAKATHRARPGKSCVIFVGDLREIQAPRTDNDREMAGEAGVPLCDRIR